MMKLSQRIPLESSLFLDRLTDSMWELSNEWEIRFYLYCMKYFSFI